MLRPRRLAQLRMDEYSRSFSGIVTTSPVFISAIVALILTLFISIFVIFGCNYVQIYKENLILQIKIAKNLIIQSKHTLTPYHNDET